MIPYLVFAIFFGLLLLGLHRKVIARIQQRPGPPVWQEILHMFKFSFKSTWIPRTASDTLFVAVVLIAIGIWTAAFFVVLAGGSLLILFGIYMLHKVVEHGFGLSSGSPYGKFGGVRSVISAASEIPLFVSIAGIAFFTKSLDITDIIDYQAVHGPLLWIVPLSAVAIKCDECDGHPVCVRLCPTDAIRFEEQSAAPDRVRQAFAAKLLAATTD